MRVPRAAALAAALAIAVAAGGCGGAETPKGEPTLRSHPVPSGEAVLAMPGAEVHSDAFATNDAGDLLSTVIVTGSESSEWCQSPSPAALVWSGHDGGRRVWTGDVMARMIAPAEGGFVVGAVRADCTRSTSGPHGDAGAYLVTGSGDTVDVRWPAGPAGVSVRATCEQNPADDRCDFSAVDGTVRLAAATTRAPHGESLGEIGGLLLGRSVSSRVLWWSADSGATWQHRRTSLPQLGDGFSLVLNDRLIGFSNGTSVELSADQGRTWSTRALPLRLETVGVTDSGVLVGVVPPSKPHRWSDYRVVVSTDDTWADVVAMPARATLGPLWTEVHGEVVYVYNNPAKWWISPDAGAHWRIVEPLPASR